MSGTFYSGKTIDGSDMIQSGLYLHPNGEEWSNKPYPDEVYAPYETIEEREERRLLYKTEMLHNSISTNGRSWLEEYELIKQKKSMLSRVKRDYIVRFVEDKLK